MKLFKEFRTSHLLTESGMRNIAKIAKKYKKFFLYFHQDLDGVTSAIAMKAYLEGMGLKMSECEFIQYGGREYTLPDLHGDKDTFGVLVDFAHGKPKAIIKVHTDHHDGQVGVEKGTSVSFKHTPSNVQDISMRISPRELFPSKDLAIISMVDSAAFGRAGITPDQVMNTLYTTDKNASTKENHQRMGLVVNKVLLAFKNKPNFLKDIVKQAKPSLISMYTVIKSLQKKYNFVSNSELMTKGENYIQAQTTKVIKDGKLSDVLSLKSGAHVQLPGRVVAQYGGGSMVKGGYDRYVPFKLHPDAVTYTVAWPLGLIQASYNPFIKVKPVHVHLGKACMKMLDQKWKSKLSKQRVTLDFIKWTFEKDASKVIKSGGKPIGFKMTDLLALIDLKQLEGIGAADSKWTSIITDITNKPYSKLSKGQTNLLRKVSVSLWDIIQAGSGGHPGITNISGLNFAGKGYIDNILHPMQRDIAQVLMDLSKDAGVV